MLDAWIAPSGDGICANDGCLVPGAPVAGASLADVLEPENEALAAEGRIRAVLASIALDAGLFTDTAVIGTDGRYSHGITAGQHGKDHAGARLRRRGPAGLGHREQDARPVWRSVPFCIAG